MTGSWLQIVGLAWLVLTLTESPLALGAVVGAQFLPVLLLSPFGGIAADRWPKRRTLAIAQACAMLQALALAMLTVTGAVQVWHLYVLAVIAGAIQAVDSPARASMARELVPGGEIANAVALSSTVWTLSRMVGPALGGIVISTLGVAACFFINAASFVPAIAGLALIDPRQLHGVPNALVGSVVAQLREGIDYATRSRDIVLPLILLVALGAFGLRHELLIPLMARYLLETDALQFGLLTSAVGVGSTVATIVVAYRRSVSVGTLIVSASVFSGTWLLIAASQSLPVTAALLAVLGMSGSTFLQTGQSRLQVAVPDALRGRVMSIWHLLYTGTTPVGSVILGGVAGAVGVAASIALAGALCAVGVLVAATYWRRTRPGSSGVAGAI